MVAFLVSVTAAEDPEPDSNGTEPNNPTESLGYPGKEMRDGFVNSSKQIEAAIQAEPDEAAHYVGLADVQIFLWCYGFAPHAEVMPRCETAVRKALALNPNLAAAHTAMGIVLLGQRDWSTAEHHLRLATELEPHRPESRHWYALYLAAMNRHEEALKQSQKSYELDSSLGMTIARSSIFYFARDWQKMIELLEPVIAQDPKYGPAYDWLGMAYVQEEQFDKAIPTYLRAAELSDELAEVLGGLGHAYAVAGREQEARQVLGKLQQMSEHWHVPPVQVAFIHVGLGEKEQALNLLEQAFSERSWELVFMQTEAWLDDLRDEPKFTALVEKMSFPQQ